jgi:two-component system, OmpR family, response regulator QseB
MTDQSTSQAGEPDNALLHREPNPPHRILVVDDDISNCQRNAKVLLDSGYDVDVAADGAAAWQALDTDSYNLVITDDNLPRVSGVELLKKLRAARMALPVIMAKGKLAKEEFTRSSWLQPAATLLKPYTVAEMLRTVKAVLDTTDGAREEIAPLTNWQSQPSAEGLQLR